jgi:hypothetical protein
VHLVRRRIIAAYRGVAAVNVGYISLLGNYCTATLLLALVAMDSICKVF